MCGYMKINIGHSRNTSPFTAKFLFSVFFNTEPKISLFTNIHYLFNINIWYLSITLCMYKIVPVFISTLYLISTQSAQLGMDYNEYIYC